jgi:hypothetical protein
MNAEASLVERGLTTPPVIATPVPRVPSLSESGGRRLKMPRVPVKAKFKNTGFSRIAIAVKLDADFAVDIGSLPGANVGNCFRWLCHISGVKNNFVAGQH